MLDRTIDELGVDSLVAVDVRSWFLKELNVDMPVLKLLSGATVDEVLTFAQERLSPGLIPKLGAGIGSDGPEPENGSIQSKESAAEESNQRISKVQSSIELGTSTSGTGSSGFTSSDNGSLVGSIGDESPPSPPSEFEPNEKSPQGAVVRTAPLSYGQSRFWFLRQYVDDPTAFNITTSIRLTGKLCVEDLERAVKAVAQQHEALRTRFSTNKDHEPIQEVLESSLLYLEQISISDESDIDKEYLNFKEHVYDLERGETMRIKLLTLSSTSFQLILGYHHISMDGVSFEIFFSDLEKAYQKRPVAPDILQYPDFSLRQRMEYSEGGWKDMISFWQNEFPDIPSSLPLLPMSTTVSRPTLTRYSSHRHEFRVTSSLSLQIQDICRKLKVTTFHFYLTVFKVLLFRFADTDDLCIGIADANRTGSDMLESLGFYLNLLPLRLRSQRQSKQTFSDALREVKTKCQAVFANSKVPFDILMHELHVQRSAAHSPLFQVLFNYRKGVAENRMFANCISEGEKFDFGQTAYDLSIDIIDNPGGESLIMLAVQKALYTVDHGDLLMKTYVSFLESFAVNPASRWT